ncbi:hypothetical protein FHR70_002539 [Microvirga lupini]|uniref:Uncharacterized protein n=1 Tax=Microvirga lupini TaxID=420324 RepID=A0A7W4YXQ7_9HYPH|nr:hypothetical protein [Microvirga lupini]MBB3019474.1 hypothetical protein [Microvirga lupini]
MIDPANRRQPLPSSRKLAGSVALAAASAAVILILLVLPAEYEIDKTGFGRLIGLVPTDEERARAFVFDPPMIPAPPGHGRPIR